MAAPHSSTSLPTESWEDWAPTDTELLGLECLEPRHFEGACRQWSVAKTGEFARAVHDLRGEPIPTPTPTPADSEFILELFRGPLADGVRVRWAVIAKRQEALLGGLRFNHGQPPPELAIYLRPDQWRQVG